MHETAEELEEDAETSEKEATANDEGVLFLFFYVFFHSFVRNRASIPN